MIAPYFSLYAKLVMIVKNNWFLLCRRQVKCSKFARMDPETLRRQSVITPGTNNWLFGSNYAWKEIDISCTNGILLFVCRTLLSDLEVFGSWTIETNGRSELFSLNYDRIMFYLPISYTFMVWFAGSKERIAVTQGKCWSLYTYYTSV